MPAISLIINRVKILDCADDDEDMTIHIYGRVKRNGQWQNVISKFYNDVHVEEENKIGNDSKCVFAAGEQREHLSDVDEADVVVYLRSEDGDGLDWGGDHIHRQAISSLPIGRSDFVERKAQSDNPGRPSNGDYELSWTIVRES